MLKVGQSAPQFNLSDQAGQIHSLDKYLGKWVLLYFYPKDMTPGCTTEACSFRDNYHTLNKKLVVLGVSADSVVSHEKFSKKYDLPFSLLSDETKNVLKAYQSWGPKKFMGKEFLGTLRISYLINPQGKIAKIYPKVNPKTHVADILRDLDELQ